MKIVTAENGKKRIKISKKEWESIGKKAGWTKIAQAQQFTKKYFILGNRQTGQIVKEGTFDYSGNPDDLDRNAADIIQSNGLGGQDNLSNMNKYWRGNSFIGTNFVLVIDSDQFKAKQVYQMATKDAVKQQERDQQNVNDEKKEQRETRYVKQYGMPPNNDLSRIPVDETQWPVR